MQISVSSTLTVFHDGQFWVGIVEHIEDGRLGAARIVFGAEPSDEEVLRFVVEKRRQREASKALKQPPASTKAQLALAEQREASKRAAAEIRKRRREEGRRARFEQRAEKRKEKKRGH